MLKDVSYVRYYQYYNKNIGINKFINFFIIVGFELKYKLKYFIEVNI